jgi:spermidine synthase
MVPWKTLATVPTKDGPLELRQRSESEYLIVVGGRVLMTSTTKVSEQALATLAVNELVGKTAPRILIGGLGMGYTLRAALDTLTKAKLRGTVTVCELTRTVVDWCQGPLAPLTQNAVGDRRVSMVVGDVAAHIARVKPGYYDAIVLDLYEGPYKATQGREDPFFGPEALARTHAALAPDGVFAVWAEDHDGAFVRRLETNNFTARFHKLGQGGRRHVVYIAKRVEVRTPRAGGSAGRGAPNRAAPASPRKPRR